MDYQLLSRNFASPVTHGPWRPQKVNWALMHVNYVLCSHYVLFACAQIFKEGKECVCISRSLLNGILVPISKDGKLSAIYLNLDAGVMFRNNHNRREQLTF